jgi:hypothetical protein
MMAQRRGHTKSLKIGTHSFVRYLVSTESRQNLDCWTREIVFHRYPFGNLGEGALNTVVYTARAVPLTCRKTVIRKRHKGIATTQK